MVGRGFVVGLAVACPLRASAVVPVYCATDDLHAAVELAGNGQTVEIRDSETCDLGATTLLLDESTSVVAAAGQTPTLAGSAHPLILVDHNDTATVTLQGLVLQTADGQTAVAIDVDDVELSDLLLESGPSPDQTAITVGVGRTGIVLDHVTVRGFEVPGAAAGLATSSGADVEVRDSWFDGLTGGAGTAIRATDTTLVVTRTLFCGGTTAVRAPAVQVDGGGTATLQNNLLIGNHGGQGGALSAQGTTALVLRNNHFVGNDSGGVHVDGPAAPLIDSNLFLQNSGVAVDLQTGTAADVDFNLYWANGTLFAGVITSPGPNGISQLDADLVAWPTTETDCSRMDLRPMAGSPLLDGGTFDANFDDDAPFSGDRNDIGAFGGPERDPDWDDRDGDNDPYGTDCDDLDPTFSQFAADVCDAADLDQDCSGTGDDDPAQHVTRHPDADGDGFGAASAALAFTGCPEDAPGGDWVEDATDCNDDEPEARPGLLEQCDHLDNDCNGAIDDGAADATLWGPDGDGDGFGAASGEVLACFRPTGFAPSTVPDCNDGDPLIRPFGPEFCDGQDSNCDGYSDEDDTAYDWYADGDGDGHGTDDADPAFSQCESPGPGYSPSPTDCLDTDAAVHQGAPELCDGLDNDCDGGTDDADPQGPDASVYYPDVDGDGLGDAFGRGQATCTPPPGMVDNALDCDDHTPDDGGVGMYWPDLDGDGFGDDRELALESCVAPAGWVDNGDDCADWLSGVNPGAPEVPGDDVDNDCDGVIDEVTGTPADTGPLGDDDDDTTDGSKEDAAGCDGCDGGTRAPHPAALLAAVLLLRSRRRARCGRDAR